MARPIDANRASAPPPRAAPVSDVRTPARAVAPTPADIRDDGIRSAPREQRERGAVIYRFARALRGLLGRAPAPIVRRPDAIRRAWHGLAKGGDLDARFRGPVGSDCWIDGAKATELMRPGVSHRDLKRAELDPLLDARRRVLSAMFNGVCMDVHARLGTAVMSYGAAARLLGWRRHKPLLEPSESIFAVYASPRPGEGLREALETGVMQREPCVLVATSKVLGTVPGTNATTLAIPVGDYGRELADALMFATQVMMGAARKTRLTPAGPLAALARVFTFQGGASRLVNPYRAGAIEGVVSIAQAVAQLSARRVPGKDAEAVLDDVLRPLMQLAVTAPFATLAPLTNHGYTPRGPMTYDQHGRAGLPADLLTMISVAHRDRLIMAEDEVLDDTVTPAGQNETKRGCPVAFGTPTLDGHGKLTDGDAGLHVLTADFIQLTKLYLRQHATPPA